MSDKNKEDIEDEYRTLCAELNMDNETQEEAWRAYTHTRQIYTLEGNQLHWLACALYDACRRSSVPTVGAQSTVEGNGVSLTRLLRNCSLSLIQFFDKARKWADMNNLKNNFVDKIEKLKRNFAVSHVIFKKYHPIFVHLFKDPSLNPPRLKTSRKQKRPPCLPSEVFDFGWTLFIRVKCEFPGISDDLVNSYHLLLSCVDYIHANAAIDKRSDLLMEDPVGVEGVPCILDRLCADHDGIPNEVKSIREHYLKPYIKKLFDEKFLKGDEENMCGILNKEVFEINFKNLRKEYEVYVLNIGEYDERVFLGEEATTEIGTPTKVNVGTPKDSELAEKIGVARRNLEMEFSGESLIPSTPLSGRHYIKSKEQQLVTPISTATYLVSRLNKMVAGRKSGGGPELATIFAKCNENTKENLKEKIKVLGSKFTDRYTAPTDNHPGSHASFAAMRLRMGEVLFYRILEKILVAEQKTSKSISMVLEQDAFIQVLFTACLEIVIFSYNSQRTFPWILDTFGLEAYQFYKVIEIIIRNEDSLARDVVKHLQRIEEQILESRAWVHSSPVWDAIRASEFGVPSCEDVSLPAMDTAAIAGQSPLSHHKSFAIRSPMTGDRFKSPVVTALARRQLFSAGMDPSGVSVLSVVPPAATAITFSPMKSGSGILSPMRPGGVMASPMKGGVAASRGGGRSKRTGSLSLFLRKVYNLAHLRLETLCNSMQLMDSEVRRKIWTCLEYTLMNHSTLMRDRHLDQLVMCSLYIVCKVSGRENEKNFTDIMRHYRSQPQAASHVYRSVLLKPVAPGDMAAAADKSHAATGAPPTPTRMANTSTVGTDGVERGDLIKFYNTVYMEKMQEFALKFRRQASLPPLSPLPVLRANPASPCRKVSESHSLYIRALKPNSTNKQFTSPMKPLSYSFSSSPAKDLDAINAMVRAEGGRKVGKRLLVDDGDDGEDEGEHKLLITDPTQPRGGANRMVEFLIGERSEAIS